MADLLTEIKNYLATSIAQDLVPAPTPPATEKRAPTTAEIDAVKAYIFRDTSPDAPDHTISIFEEPAAPTASDSTAIRPVQIQARDKDYDTAKTLAYSIKDKMASGADEVKLGITRLAIGRPRLPFFLKLDNQGRAVFAVNVYLITNTQM